MTRAPLRLTHRLTHRLALAGLLVGALLPRAASAAPARTALTWYGQSAFVVKTPRGTVLAIDPWLSNPLSKDPQAAQKLTKVDFILVSHGHADHVGDSVDIAKRTGAKFVGPLELAQQLMAAGYPMDPKTIVVTAGNMGGPIQLTDEVSVTMVPAVHSSGFQKDPQSPPAYAGNPVGFVIRIKDGPTLYHTGDTAAYSDMKLVSQAWGPIDVMLACIGGHFTMDPAAAALAVSWVDPKTVIPMHFGTFPVLTGTVAEFQRALGQRHTRAKLLELKVGETREF